MAFYNSFRAWGIVAILALITPIGASNAEDNTGKQEELKKRVNELQTAMANLGQTLSNQAQDSTSNLRTDVQKQLDELGKQLEEVKQRIATQTTDSRDAVRRDLGNLLKELGDTLNTTGTSLSDQSTPKPTSSHQPANKK